MSSFLRAVAVASLIGGMAALASSPINGCDSTPIANAGGGRGGGMSAAGAAGTIATGGGGVAGDGAMGGGGNPAPPLVWPIVLRLVNAGTAEISIPENQTMTCGFSIAVAGPGLAGGSPPFLTSSTPPDSWCECDACAPGRRNCQTIDPICDGAPSLLASGDHLDFEWDGRAAIMAGAPPPGSTCPGICDRWTNVSASGEFVFTVTIEGDTYPVKATLPASGGVIPLPIVKR